MPRLEFELALPGVTREVLWRLHESPEVLPRLSPPDKRVRVVRLPPAMGEGAEIVIRVEQFGVSLEWVSLIEVWEPPVRFVDVQKKGPFSIWRHEHLFSDGLLTDRVDYEVPLARMGGAAIDRLVIRPDLCRMFAHRHRVTRELLAGGPAA
ncbi:MAG: SRPBCC family protein [Thermoanaerobaculia bacterium]|nr:SRPBCC family protein [Thermoanaerobaculia bacterium]